MNAKCELCDEDRPCAIMEASTYDDRIKGWLQRVQVRVCEECVSHAGGIVTASALSWLRAEKHKDEETRKAVAAFHKKQKR